MNDILTNWLELYRLNVDYWHDVDTNWGRRAHEFYAEDGVFHAVQDTIFTGRDEIRKFYSWRESRGARVARHCISNFRATLHNATHATSNWILILYAADGAPVLPAAAPIQIADGVDECVKGGNGVWRYASRKLISQFAGGQPVTLPPKTP